MHSADRNRLLAWTLGVPFFVMPVALTVDAPDIFGGYGIHLRWAATLLGVGLCAGAVHAFGPRVAALRGSRWVRALAAAGWALGLLALAGVLATGASLAGRQLARLIGGLPLGPEPPRPPDLPDAFVVTGLLVLLVRVVLGRGRSGPSVRVVAALAGVAQAGAWLHANQFTTGRVPMALVLVVALGIAAAWPRWMRPSEGRERLAWGLILGWLFAASAAATVRMLAPVASLPVGFPVRPVALVLALPIALLGAWAIARWLQSLSGAPGAAQLAEGMVRLAQRLPLLVALTVFVGISSSFVVLAGGLLVELFGWLPVESTRRWAVPALPQPLYLVWWIVLLRFGVPLRSRLDLHRFLAATSAGFTALVAGRIGALLLPDVGSIALWAGLAVVLLGLLVVVPRLSTATSLGRGLLALGVLAAPLACGPLIARYLLAAGVGGAPSLALCVVLGCALALPLPWWALRGSPAEPVGMWGIATRLPLLAVALLLPIYITVHAGLRPASFFLTVATLATLLVGTRLSRGPLRGLPPLPVSVALWLLFYAGFVQTAVFKLGPSAEQCARIVRDTSARTLLARHAEGGEYLDAYPYDAVPLPGRSTVLASFKRIDKQGGFVEVIDGGEPTRRARTRVQRDGEGGPLWPERINTDPKKDRALVQVIGVDAHGMWELLPQGAPDDVLPVRIGQRMALQYEPGNPALDGERRTLAITYVPNREGGNPLIEVFDLDTLTSRGANRETGHMMQMADFVETDRGSGRHYAPTLFSFLRFAVIEVTPGLALARHREMFHPIIGLAADPAHARLYLTNPLAGVMEVMDLDTFEVVQRVPVGTFPRDVAFDPERERLYVANYGDGSVVTFSTENRTLTEVGRAEVGWLLRGLGVDEGSGRVVAASACGVFAIEG